MADWADIAANRALSTCNLLAYSHDDHNIIAAALRQARLDALEEAAMAAEGIRDDELHKFAKDEYSRSYGKATANDCAQAIRSLKEKQP